MKKQLFLVLFTLGWSVDYLQASVTYAQIQTAIYSYNGDQCEALAIAALAQTNRLCVFQGLVYSGTDLTVQLRFTSCALFSNYPSGCNSINNYTAFCDNIICCTNTTKNPITARVIDVLLLLSVQAQAYEVVKFLLTACPYATVNINNISSAWTLLMYACQQGNLAAAKLLITYGADLTACSNTGLSVIDIAQSPLYQDMINLLIYTDRMNLVIAQSANVIVN
jgi:hypothetical protein